ncbi:MAG: TlyA family RNA methyltransferase, partial [Spirochaetales bacterium]|nr:TlyA family RNA methyltransferase [Spirochaetales bacterium]
WKVEAQGKTVLDAGSSTGGFTDCLLQRGAARVHAVDVGRGQLHPALKKDPRVTPREKTNIMSLASLDPAPAFAVCDLSFRSLRGAASHITGLTSEGRLIALVKPQFEWQAPGADFRGVVRGAESLRRILAGLLAGLEAEGLTVHDIIKSPLTGRAGNREFFFDLRTTPCASQTPEESFQRCLQEKIELLTG